jgi:dipeptidyl aminopeptidase/acylaminoacyl peptidase
MIPSDLSSVPVVAGGAISPDGSRVAYALLRADAGANVYRAGIRVIERAAGTITELTRGIARDANPQWMPDGRRLAFVSDRSGTPQLWFIDVGGGEAYAGPPIPAAVSDFAISPDGRKIAAIALPATHKAEAESRGWRRVTRLRYRADGLGYFDDFPRVWLVDLDSGDVRELTDGTGFVSGPAWSPDGTRLAFAGEHDVTAEGIKPRELWLVDLRDGGAPRKMLSMRGVLEAPAWSPDGTHIAFCGRDNPRSIYGLANLRLFSVPASGGAPQCLTPSEEWTCGDNTLTDVGAANSSAAPVWLADGALCVLGTSRGATRVFRVEPTAGVSALSPPEMSALSLCADRRGVVVFGASSSGMPPELFETSGAEVRRLTHESSAWCAAMGIRDAQRFSASGPAGSIDAWRIRGEGPEPRPCILQIHGGPHAAYGEAFVFEFQLLAAAGYDVVYCNPRGSQGYGEPFAAAIVGDWGEPALADCLAALDRAIADGGIAEKRLGVAGGSYGGYLTAWAISHSRRFLAAVAMRAAINLESLWGTSEVGRLLLFEMGGKPADIPEVYRRNSPLTYADAITAPLLLIHSERDYRCPIEQAEQLYAALKLRGHTVELLRFPEADHGLSRTGPPKLRIARLEALVDWFDRHV